MTVALKEECARWEPSASRRRREIRMGNQPTSQIVTRERQPVKMLLAAPPLLRCVLCQATGTSDDLHADIRTGYDVCRDIRRCRDRRNGIVEPTVIRVQTKHLVCDCCAERIRNGMQRLFVLGARVEHADHDNCGPGCRVRRRGVPA